MVIFLRGGSKVSLLKEGITWSLFPDTSIGIRSRSHLSKTRRIIHGLVCDILRGNYSQDSSIQEIPVVVISSRDPNGEPIASDMLTVTQGGGLSVRNLLACIQAVSEILAPSEQL